MVLISQVVSQDIMVAVNVDLKGTTPEVMGFLEQYNTSSNIAVKP